MAVGDSALLKAPGFTNMSLFPPGFKICPHWSGHKWSAVRVCVFPPGISSDRWWSDLAQINTDACKDQMPCCFFVHSWEATVQIAVFLLLKERGHMQLWPPPSVVWAIRFGRRPQIILAMFPPVLKAAHSWADHFPNQVETGPVAVLHWRILH